MDKNDERMDKNDERMSQLEMQVDELKKQLEALSTAFQNLQMRKSKANEEEQAKGGCHEWLLVNADVKEDEEQGKGAKRARQERARSIPAAVRM